MLEKGDAITTRFLPASLTLTPTNANLYARRHSAHSYPTTEQAITGVSASFFFRTHLHSCNYRPLCPCHDLQLLI